MKRQITFLFYFILFLSAKNLGGTILVTEKASRNSENNFFSFFHYHIEIEIYENGAIKTKDKNGIKSNKNFNLEKDENIINVMYSGYHNNEVILIVEKSNDESGNILISRMTLINQRIMWKTELPIINPAPGLIEKNFLYIAGAGAVAKVNLCTGKVEWKTGELKNISTGNPLEISRIKMKRHYLIAIFSGIKDELESISEQVLIRKKDGTIIKGAIPRPASGEQE